MTPGKEMAQKQEDSGELKVYEVGYIFVPLIAMEDLPREVAGLQELIEKHGGMRISDEFPAMKTLAYPMHKSAGGLNQKFESGYFGWIKFEMSGANIGLLKNDLKMHAPLLRFIIVRTVRENTLLTAKSPLMAKTAGLSDTMLSSGTAPLRETETVISDEELNRSLEGLIAE